MNNILFVDNDGNVYIEEIGGRNIFLFNSSGLTTLTSDAELGNQYDTGPFRMTPLTGKYYAYAESYSGKANLLVTKRGQPLFNRDVRVDVPAVSWVGINPAISPNGMYIAVSVRLSDGTNKVLLYKGA